MREAAIAYALEFFDENPDADSVSMDPSDGAVGANVRIA